jgi:hypothetical protein
MHLIRKQLTLAAMILALAIAGQAEEAAEPTAKETAAVIARYLSDGPNASAELPLDFAVTIETTGAVENSTNTVFDAWRFTPTTVNRLNEKQEVVESAPFHQIGKITEVLRQGKLIDLVDAPRGTKDRTLTLLGTPCKYGYESIKVTANGRTLNVHGESCWANSFANENHRRQFKAIYGQIRSMAIDAIKNHPSAPLEGEIK